MWTVFFFDASLWLWYTGFIIRPMPVKEGLSMDNQDPFFAKLVNGSMRVKSLEAETARVRSSYLCDLMEMKGFLLNGGTTGDLRRDCVLLLFGAELGLEKMLEALEAELRASSDQLVLLVEKREHVRDEAVLVLKLGLLPLESPYIRYIVGPHPAWKIPVRLKSTFEIFQRQGRFPSWAPNVDLFVLDKENFDLRKNTVACIVGDEPVMRWFFDGVTETGRAAVLRSCLREYTEDSPHILGQLMNQIHQNIGIMPKLRMQWAMEEAMRQRQTGHSQVLAQP